MSIVTTSWPVRGVCGKQFVETDPNCGKTFSGFSTTRPLLLTTRPNSSVLAKNKTTLTQQPPYSPDLAPCDFFLFDGLNLSAERILAAEGR